MLLSYTIEFTYIKTLAALDTFILIDFVYFFFPACYRIDRADLNASSATDACIDYLVIKQSPAYSRGTFLFANMLNVFFSEMFQGAQYRIGSCLTKAAK